MRARIRFQIFLRVGRSNDNEVSTGLSSPLPWERLGEGAKHSDRVVAVNLKTNVRDTLGSSDQGQIEIYSPTFGRGWGRGAAMAKRKAKLLVRGIVFGYRLVRAPPLITPNGRGIYLIRTSFSLSPSVDKLKLVGHHDLASINTRDYSRAPISRDFANAREPGAPIFRLH